MQSKNLMVIDPALKIPEIESFNIISIQSKILLEPIMKVEVVTPEDFRSQIISCKEWFPPDNYQYCVLKKNFKDSIRKLQNRI